MENESILRWHYGPTNNDSDPGKMWCTSCGGEVYIFKEGHICSKCNRAENHTLKFKMECEGCRERSFVVTFDAHGPARMLGFECVCGHYTEVKDFTPRTAGSANDNGNETL